MMTHRHTKNARYRLGLCRNVLDLAMSHAHNGDTKRLYGAQQAVALAPDSSCTPNTRVRTRLMGNRADAEKFLDELEDRRELRLAVPARHLLLALGRIDEVFVSLQIACARGREIVYSKVVRWDRSDRRTIPNFFDASPSRLEREVIRPR